MGKNVLVISQVIPQWYVDLLTQALGEGTSMDIITGSDVRGNVIRSPKHDPRSFKSRLVCWWKHYRFVSRWAKDNKGKKYDLIFAVSNPPINSYIGLKLKTQFYAPFVYMNWDLYPQIIEETISNPAVQMICKCWSWWNSRNYPKIDRMLTIGEVMAQSLNQPLKKRVPVSVIPIAVDTGYLKPIPKQRNPFCIQYGLTDKFVVLYSGKMGIGHNIELILEAAEKLRGNPQIQFVFIGEGPKYSMVEEFVASHQSRNVLLLPMQPDDIFPYSMACGDVGIVAQEAKMAHLFMPSKTYSMMACGQAILGIGTDHDDLYRLIQTEQIGVCVTETSADVLAGKIESLFRDRQILEKYQKNARIAAEEHFSHSSVKEKYCALFEELLVRV